MGEYANALECVAGWIAGIHVASLPSPSLPTPITTPSPPLPRPFPFPAHLRAHLHHHPPIYPSGPAPLLPRIGLCRPLPLCTYPHSFASPDPSRHPERQGRTSYQFAVRTNRAEPSALTRQELDGLWLHVTAAAATAVVDTTTCCPALLLAAPWPCLHLQT